MASIKAVYKEDFPPWLASLSRRSNSASLMLTYKKIKRISITKESNKNNVDV
jgi:hypothetical protein